MRRVSESLMLFLNNSEIKCFEEIIETRSLQDFDSISFVLTRPDMTEGSMENFCLYLQFKGLISEEDAVSYRNKLLTVIISKWRENSKCWSDELRQAA